VPRLLAVGHVTWDETPRGEVLGGAVTYASLAALKLGWEAAVLTAAGSDFVAERHLPGVAVFRREAKATTRFQHTYDDAGVRHQVLLSRSDDVDLSVLPDSWRAPEALLLGPVAGEVGAGFATAFEAEVVGAAAQGWLRDFDDDGVLSARAWPTARADLAGVHVLFLSAEDLPDAASRARELLGVVPIVALTRGWEGLTLLTRDGVLDVPSLPRQEVDPTGAGDVFAAAFLVRYHENHDAGEASAFAACAASCAVEAVGAAGLGDRAEIAKRLALRERLIEEGEWDE
jgi:sugar/nucleoside kinase (ribokinase family)